MGEVPSWESANQGAIVVPLVSCIGVQSIFLVSLIVDLGELAEQGQWGSLKDWGHCLDLENGTGL
jgi:hypothetical protein